jgi:hypothetical protein
MRHGLKLKTQINFLTGLQTFFWKIINPLEFQSNFSWKIIFLTLENLTHSVNSSYKNLITPYKNQIISYNHYMHNQSKNITSTSSLFTYIYKKLLTLTSIFSFYIYKVDKKIFKNTRGKSGKFTFLWKFITPYKRLSWVMYWLAREIKLKSGSKWSMRFESLFTDLINSPHKTWVFRVKRFSYNYVYRNCRLTLAETYRTSTK